MKFKIYSILFLIAVFAITSCKKSATTNPTPIISAKMDTDIYVVGNTGTKNGKQVAAYWKNGIITKLGDSTQVSDGYAIAIDGNDIYVAGILVDDSYNLTAVYWKNGIMHTLSQTPSDNSVPKGIIVNGTDVYVPGVGGTPGLLYWKNGVPVMNTGSTSMTVSGMAISGNDIYLSGTSVLPSLTAVAASYWKNGTMVQVSSVNSYGNAIAVSGSDVYVAGMTETDNVTPHATYWKNGAATQVSSAMSNANAIAVNGSDVYVAGDSYSSNLELATYWKNGTPHVVTDNTLQSNTGSIAIIGNDVYMSGSQQIPDRPALNFRPLYWKNGVPVLLPYYANGGAGTIVIVVHQASN